MSGPNEEAIRRAHAAINLPYDSITEVRRVTGADLRPPGAVCWLYDSPCYVYVRNRTIVERLGIWCCEASAEPLSEGSSTGATRVCHSTATVCVDRPRGRVLRPESYESNYPAHARTFARCRQGGPVGIPTIPDVTLLDSVPWIAALK